MDFDFLANHAESIPEKPAVICNGEVLDFVTLSKRASRAANVFVDLSGSGVDGGMLEACVEALGTSRLLWGADITLDTGWAKLRYLERLLPADALEAVRWRNAAGIFPAGSFTAAPPDSPTGRKGRGR